MSAPVIVGVDGGNSKTDVVLADADGAVLATAAGPASSPHLIGVPGCLELLDRLISEVRARAALPTDLELARAEIYLAGADLPVEVEILSAEIGRRGWAREHRVDNDTFALLRAGTDTPDAIGVVCGAGINCVGRTAEGAMARFPALGYLAGDWGGGHELAPLIVWHAARGEDGRGPATALTAAIAGYFGLPTVEDVAIAVHLGELTTQNIYELTPLLFSVAAAGDAVATNVVLRQAEEIVTLASVAAKRLGIGTRPVDVVLGGGVLTARHPMLHDAIVAGLATRVPGATVKVLADPPVTGAVLLGLDELGTTAGSKAAMRQSIWNSRSK
jgi:N-acetylglucosamine kinase-like BadF-type ATPase